MTDYQLLEILESRLKGDEYIKVLKGQFILKVDYGDIILEDMDSIVNVESLKDKVEDLEVELSNMEYDKEELKAEIRDLEHTIKELEREVENG